MTPAEQFEELIESDTPPTVTALANIGKQSQFKAKQAPEENMECAEIMEAEEAPATRRNGRRIFVPEGENIVALCRRGIVLEEEGQTIEAVAAELGVAVNAYRLSRQIVFLADRPELSSADQAVVAEAIGILKTTLQYTKAWETALPVAQRMWGSPQQGYRLHSLAGRRMERFERTFGLVMQSCLTTNEVPIPYLSRHQSEECVKEISRARKALTTFAIRIKEIHQ